MSERMQWRFATIADSTLLAELNRQLITDEGHSNSMDAFQLELRMSYWLESEYRAVLFELGTEVVAYTLFRDDELGRIHLRQFFVVREHRRQGVGREAMRLFRSAAVPHGKRLVLEVLSTNASARAFWIASGFHEYAITFELAPEGQRLCEDD